MSAPFRILTQEQLKTREAELFRSEVLNAYNSPETLHKIKNSDNQTWVDEAIKVSVEARVKGTQDIANVEHFFKAYLNRGAKTPEIVDLINSLDR